MQSPQPTVNDVEADSQSHDTTPFTCPYSITLRRNPSRKARPTPQRAAVPFNSHHQTTEVISESPNEDVLEVEHHSKGGVGDSCSEDLKVFLRIRPLKERFERKLSKEDGELKLKKSNAWPKARKEREITTAAKDRVLKQSSVSCIVVNDNRSVTLMPPVGQQDTRRIKSEAYEGFSQVFAPESSQEQVYDTVMRPLVEDFLNRKSGMLVAMGPSGSGKTHTVFGCPREPGMVPLALRQIFQRNGEGHSMSSRSYYITIFEISSEPGKGEKISDLLSDQADISIYQSSIKGLREAVISDVHQAESAIASAMFKRSTAMTKANSQSSRSQCIISIHMDTQEVEGRGSDMPNSVALTIIDLAGAERSKRTGIQGKQLGESSFINNTSMVFGLCLRSLFEHQKNPKKPLQKHFQSSLLTRYLRDYLEGKKRMSLILTVKSEQEDYTDTSFVLRQASPYMQIKFTTAAHPDLLGAKRQLQTLVRSNHVKRAKLGNFAGPKADKKGSAAIADHHCDVKATCTDEIKEYASQKFLVESLNRKENEKNEEAHCIFKSLKRSSQIMQNFAKVIWNVLKEYKTKLRDAENKIHSLKEDLDFEKTRRMELEREIQYLKSNCCCFKEVSTDSDLVEVDTYLEFKVEKFQKSVDISEKTKPSNDIICRTSQFVGTAGENNSSEEEDLGTCLQEQSGGFDHCSDEQVFTSAVSPELADLLPKENDQQSDTLVSPRFSPPNHPESANMKNDCITGPTSAVTEPYLLEESPDNHDEKTQTSSQLAESESIESDHLSHASVLVSVVMNEHCNLLGSSQGENEQETKCFPDDMSVVKSPDQSSEVATLTLRSPPTAKVRANSPQHNTDKLVSFVNENKVPTSSVTDEHFSSLRSSQEKHEKETQAFLNNMPNNKSAEQSSEAATLALRSPSTAKTMVDSPSNKINNPMTFPDENKEILPPKKQLKQKGEKCGKDLMGNHEIPKNDTKPPSKPKRRLMPVSTVLLRDMRLLEFEDESHSKPKGNRDRKNPDKEENQRTQGNINLLRILKSSNLHR